LQLLQAEDRQPRAVLNDASVVLPAASPTAANAPIRPFRPAKSSEKCPVHLGAHALIDEFA
jgi:hypothetical protein